MFKKSPKLLLPLLLVLLCTHANAQWLKKLESSDNLYKDAKREIDLKHYQNAINMCTKALEISPHNYDIHLLLGRAYSLSGKVDSARIELNKVIEKNPRYRDAYIYLVNMEAVACNYVQALEYADQGLKYFPNDRDLLLKKLDVYNKEGDWIESNKLAEYLFDRYSSDPFIRSVYLEYKLTLARQYAHRGFIEIAKRAYESVLEQDPLNKEALAAVYNLDVRAGNYSSSLAFVNRAIQSNPNSREFLMKKVSILDAEAKYVDAIEVIEKLLKLYPNDPEIRKLNTYMRMQAGHYYMNTDPYLQFQAVLDKEPGNRDALNYVINIASSRGLNDEALSWCNFGLKKYPGDREITNKKLGILSSMKNYGAAANIAEAQYKSSPSADNKANFVELRTLAGRSFIADQDYDSAIVALKSVLFYDHGNQQAANYLTTAYTQQKRYDEAIRVIDDQLTYYPGDEGLLYKKAGILESYQHYAEAAQISKDLLQKYPDKRHYLLSFVEQSLAAGRQSLAYDDYSSTTVILKEVLEKQPDNLDALNYLINIETAFKQYDTAIVYADQALHYYPDSKDLLFKKASVYADAHRYRDAYAISSVLHNEYPYNIRFRDAYVDQLLGSGKMYMADNQPDSAVNEYYRALEVSPGDTTSLYYAINILNDQKKYDTALVLINKGRAMYPDKPYFLLKRAVVYENTQKWEDAWLAADTLTKIANLDPKYMDYANFLYSRRLKNEWSASFLRSYITDSANATTVPTINNLASIGYKRNIKRGSIGGVVTYAGRNTTTGFMFEANAYYNHTPKWFSNGYISYSPSDSVFPRFRLGYSINHTFKHDWGGELGIRYLNTYNSSTISPTASVTKEIREFYLNLRGYYIIANTKDSDQVKKEANVSKTNNYYSVVLTTRCYLSTISRTEYFSAIMGYGTAPDDNSRNYALRQYLQYPTISVAAGYSKQFKYRTTATLFASWYNTRIAEQNHINQFDIFLQLARKF